MAALLAGCATSTPDTPLMSLRAESTTKLLLVGSDGTDLGCMSCDGSDPASIVVRVKQSASATSRNSIRNHQGPFGSESAPTSACCPIATDPPRIVDSEGRLYGRLTLNLGHPEAIKDPKLQQWLKGVCTAGILEPPPEDCGCSANKPK
jgi:hypothetical protein